MAQTAAITTNPKSGFLTSEFWITFINSVIGILVMLGYLTPAEADDAIKAVTEVIAGLVVIASTIMYIYSRIVVKREHALLSTSTPPLPMNADLSPLQSDQTVVVE